MPSGEARGTPAAVSANRRAAVGIVKTHPDPVVPRRLDEQDAALQGEKGALLWVVSASDGKKLAGFNLETTPAWDGMAAANGRLYLSTTDGKVLCFAGK